MCVHMSVHATEEVLGSEDKIERLRLCSASASGSVSQDSCCDIAPCGRCVCRESFLTRPVLFGARPVTLTCHGKVENI